MKKYLLILLFLVLAIIFFNPLFLKGLLPIPADNVVGLYYPYRDLFATDFPNGIPFKNFLLTDPVRQQFPWRELSVSSIKALEFPIWNPYNFCGTPLLANFQSGAFYIFNLFFLFLPFNIGWSLLIFSQVFLSGLFLYLYLRNLRLSIGSSVFGGVAFSFSGFSIAWLEWGTMLQTALWLPLILYFTDRLFLGNKKLINIIGIILSLSLSLFAGHPQIFFYVFIFFLIYYIARLLQKKEKRFIFYFFYILIPFLVITSVQWFPTLNFSLLSARSVDQDWHIEGFFIPWQNLIQLIAPDFFGNPSTLNYWGVWNYGELVSYIGILPLIFAIFCLFYRKDKKTLFFGTLFFISLIFSLPTVFAKIPYRFELPLLSNFQPTRMIFIIDFCLAVLGALGIEYFVKNKKRVFYPFLFIGIILLLLWIIVFNPNIISGVLTKDLLVSKSNLFLPTILFIISAFLIFIPIFKRNRKLFYVLIIAVLIFDLFRFGWKFTPFSKASYLYPQTKITKFLTEQKKPFRIMSTDARILPPNFSIIHRIESVDGYDPLYLLRYGELIAAMGREKADISSPFGFNRIITPQNYLSRLSSLLNVKYVLSLDEIKSDNFKKILEEGQTKIYENTNVYPRLFFVQRTIGAKDKKEAINIMFDKEYPLIDRAVVEAEEDLSKTWSVGTVEISSYKENNIQIKTKNEDEGFMVLTDSYYPSWHVKIDNKEGKIYRTDYNFRGVIVPGGEHKIEFYNSLF